jgi:4-hydroxy-tetrahydrodipicolinate synthase
MAHDLSKLRGIIPPMVTPLLAADALDLPGLERLIEHILTAPVAGLFILGTTGEGPNLSARLRREVIDHSIRQVSGRVPLLVGITDTSFADSVALAWYAADRGATAVVAAPPYYHKPTPEELRRWLTRLAASVPLPLYPYNMPAHTRTWIDFETIRLAMDLPNCPGFKDSSGELTYFDAVLKLRNDYRPDWRVYIGPEHLTRAATGLGGDGGVNGGANLVPRLFTDLFAAADGRDRQLDAGRALHLGRSFRRPWNASAASTPSAAGNRVLFAVSKPDWLRSESAPANWPSRGRRCRAKRPNASGRS